MKKGLILLLSLFMATGAVFADVAVEMGDTVTLVFTYENPDAGEVYLAGTMNGWDPAATMMEKGEDGVWTYSLNTGVNEEVKYKFVVDGVWTFDTNAPQSVDDGFGGNNGLVVPKNLVGASSSESDGPILGLTYGNFTAAAVISEFQTEGKDATDKGINHDNTKLKSKAYWKWDGYVLPWLKWFGEVKMWDNELFLYNKGDAYVAGADPEVDWENGLKTLLGTGFHPVNGFNGGNPSLGKTSIQIETPYVNVWSGYGGVKGHILKDYLYNIVEKDAGDGSIEFFNPETYDFGGVTVDYMVSPNKTKGTFNAVNYVNVGVAGLENQLVYILAGSTGDDQIIEEFADTSKGAKHIFALGSKGTFGDVEFKAQAQTQIEDSEAELTDITAMGAYVSYSTDAFGVGSTVKFAGPDVYTEYSDDDGTYKKGNLYAELNPWVKAGMAKVGLDTNYTFGYKMEETDDINLFFKPYTDLTLGNNTLSAYAKLNADLIGADKDMGMKFSQFGAKYSMPNLSTMVEQLDLHLVSKINYLAWDAAEKTYELSDIEVPFVASVDMPSDVNVYGGLTYRMSLTDPVDETINPFGLSLGIKKVVASELMKSPVVYAMVDYNNFIYDWDSGLPKPELKLDDYYPEDMSKLDGKAQVRIGVKWDF